jgi:hypothetical protein|tara:strand:+ start:1295 stop:1567 length:273 start_codon:yes stop_codon:yes gene_type:complete
MEATVGAVLMIGHFVVSIFNVQLGNPVIYSLPFTTMEQCQQYQKYMPQEPIKIDLEWSHATRSQCFTKAEFQKMMQRQAGQQPGGKPPTE